MPSLNHIHKYIRRVQGKNNYIIYACALPDCTHYLPKKLAIGKRTLCHNCGDEMILTSDIINKGTVKPTCGCKQGKVDKEIVEGVLEDLGDLLVSKKDS